MNSFPNFLPRRAAWLSLSVVVMSGAALTVDAAGPWQVRKVSARAAMRGYAVEPLAANDLRAPERAFLTKAAETARQQMRLAEVGVSQATTAEVRSHAQQLVSDYRSLNDALAAITRRKGGIAGAPVGGTSETFQKLVENAGPSFDREFIRTVGRITDDMLSLFEQVASDSKDEDVRELAAAQLPVLRAHRSEITELEKRFG